MCGNVCTSFASGKTFCNIVCKMSGKIFNVLTDPESWGKTVKLGSDKIWILKWSFINIKWNLRSILSGKDKGWPQYYCQTTIDGGKYCLAWKNWNIPSFYSTKYYFLNKESKNSKFKSC